MKESTKAAKKAAAADPAGPRARRSKQEVAERIRQAAREVFAARGYAGATTKEIARQAEASETLVFRYFNSKAELFDATISAPFNELMDAFLSSNPPTLGEPDRAVGSAAFVEALTALLNVHHRLLHALIVAPDQQDDLKARSSLHGLDVYFERAVLQLEQQYLAEGGTADIDLPIAVRVGFGMVVATVLLRNILFGDNPPPAAVLTEVLQKMLFKVFNPVVEN